MKAPPLCYQKAFWLLFGVMTTVLSVTGGVVWGIVEDTEVRSLNNELELEHNKEAIKLIPRLYENQIIMCTALEAPCK